MSDHLKIVANISEYHLVFISLILAAAVTEILSSLGTYIRNRRYIKFSYIIAGWMFLSLLATIQFWYAITDYYMTIQIKCPKIEQHPYFSDIISATFYYLLSRLVFPDFSSYNFSEKIKNCCKKNIEIDRTTVSKYSLDNYYYRNSITLCSVAIVLVLISVFKSIVYRDNILCLVDASIIYHKTLYRASFLVIIFIAFGTSFYEKNYPDEIQAKKDEFDRKFTGVAYKYNLLMTAFFTLLFLLYVFTYMKMF